MSTLFIILVLVLSIWYVGFRIKYSKPLTEREVLELAKLRRNKEIYNYYNYSQIESSVNSEFKRKMKPTGKFYEVDESLFSFPSIAAALLKYKKHEWIMIGFEKNKQVDLMWVNKGFDKESVSLMIDFNEIIQYALKGKFSTLMIFHNHPNRNPNIYDCTKPSEMDIYSATEWWNKCKDKGINFIEYICERGLPYRYYLKTIDSFIPIDNVKSEIIATNDISKSQNYKLHLERMRFAKTYTHI